MPACHALTRAGHPCRGHGVYVKNEVGSEGYLCHRHTHYFDVSRPDQHLAELVSPYLTYAQDEWLTRMLSSPLYRREDRARTLSFIAPYHAPHAARGSMALYRGVRMYRHYVKAGALAPMAVLELWKKNMHGGMNIIGYSCTVRPAPEGQVTVEIPSHFRHLVQTTYGHLVRGIPSSAVLRYFLQDMRTPSFAMNPPLFHDPLRQAKAAGMIWKRVIEEVVRMTANRYLVGMSVEKIVDSIEEFHVKYPDSLWWKDGAREYVTDQLKNVQRCAREDERWRMGMIKRELMEAAWKSERVARWVEAGMDLAD